MIKIELPENLKINVFIYVLICWFFCFLINVYILLENFFVLCYNQPTNNSGGIMFNSMAYLIAADAGLMDFLAWTKIILVALMGIGAIAIIILVLCQKGNSGGGMQALTGNSETYYSQNKGSTVEGRLKRWTIGIAIAIAVITIAYFILLQFVSGDA